MQNKLLKSLILSIATLLILIVIISCNKSEMIEETNNSLDNGYLETVTVEECMHNFSEWEIITPATCTQNGKNLRICSLCELIDIEYIPKLEHDAKIIEVIPPTCNDEGFSVYLCQCSYTYKSDYTIPTGHSLKKDLIVEKTCTDVGYTHYQCQNCEYNFDSDLIPQDHEFELSITRPTVTQSGFTTYTCKNCAYHYDNNITKYKDILPTPYVDSSIPICKGLDIYDEEHETDASGNYLPIDWKSIKDQGYDFVILKVGSDVSKKSKTFDMDYEGAKAAGLGVGAYYYAYSSTVSGTRNDAQEVLEWIKGKQFEYPIYYDIEENYLADSLSKDSLTEIITVFIEELQINGYYSALYVNNNWLNNILDSNTILDRFDIWYARYPEATNPQWDKSKYGEQLSMWQYTDKGIVEGIDTKIDLNYCYRDYPSLMKQWGLNGFEKEN